MSSSKAVVLIGGPLKGLRFRPLEYKPLFKIAGRELVWHHIQSLSKLDDLQEVILIGVYEDTVFAPFLKTIHKDFPDLNVRYLREYESLGTAGGLYHFRDSILKGNPAQIFVLHADVLCSNPLAELRDFHESHRGVGTLLTVKVPRDEATKYGCIVSNPATKQVLHYVEKPNNYISDTINSGVYLFDKSIFDEIKNAMDEKIKKMAEDPMLESDDQLRLEQDVLAPMAHQKKLFCHELDKNGFWCQIKTAASALPANAKMLASYKTTNPVLLRQRSPTMSATAHAASIAQKLLPGKSEGPEIVAPCFIDETAEIDPTAKIGPNVSIGASVKVGYGCRVRDSIVLENTTLDKNSVVQYSIVGEDCKIGQWSRVEGLPAPPADQGGVAKQSVTILANDVTVKKEISVRSCIVLPHKSLEGRNFASEVLL